MTSRVVPTPIRREAFTLIELLAVVAIFLTLAALTGPAINSTLAGMKITSATELAVDEIQNARSTALARNAPVDVWFLKDADQFHILRTSIVEADSTSRWISRARILPEGIALASAETYSNLIGSQTSEAPPDSPAGTMGVRLRVFPSGRVELPSALTVAPNMPLYFTIVPAARFDPNSGDALPANFATVQINPINARITTFRP